MNKPLDLENIKAYTYATEDTIEARKFIGQKGYFSNYDDFKICFKLTLCGISPIGGMARPYFGRDKKDEPAYGYERFIPCENAKFKE